MPTEAPTRQRSRQLMHRLLRVCVAHISTPFWLRSTVHEEDADEFLREFRRTLQDVTKWVPAAEADHPWQTKAKAVLQANEHHIALYGTEMIEAPTDLEFVKGVSISSNEPHHSAKRVVERWHHEAAVLYLLGDEIPELGRWIAYASGLLDSHARHYEDGQRLLLTDSDLYDAVFRLAQPKTAAMPNDYLAGQILAKMEEAKRLGLWLRP